MVKLIEFKAGILKLENNTLKAEPQKGKITIERDHEDMLSFLWSSREAEGLEKVYKLKPGDASIFPLPNCTNTNAFVLKESKSKQRFFFWIQEVDWKSYNESFTNQVNEILRGNRMSIVKKTEDSKHSLKTINTTFSSILAPAKVSLLLNNNALASEKLTEFLPPSLPKTPDELYNTVRSPQFLQTVSFMDETLGAGDLNPLLMEMDIDPEYVLTNGGVAALLSELAKKRQQKK